MYEPQHHRHDSPPEYSPPAYGPPVYSAPYSAVPQHSSYHHVPYRCGPNAGFKEPQHFYRCLSPPVLVRTFKGITALMCFIIVALVASTLMWESSGYWGGYMEGSYGTFYTGTYNSYTSPMAAKTAMMVVSGVNFILSLAILIWSCSQTRISRGCRFYLGVFICDIILAVLQGIIDIIFAIEVNPMAQSSQSMLYNPLLTKCKTSSGSPSLSASLGGGFPAGYPLYNQHLHHYCYMDPEEVAALLLGLFVVLALSMSAFYAYKTRSKIWRHGKASILWDHPHAGTLEGQDVQDWVDHFEEPHSCQSAVAWPSAPPLPLEDSVVSYSNGAVSLPSEGAAGGHSIYPNLHMGPRTEF